MYKPSLKNIALRRSSPLFEIRVTAQLYNIKNYYNNVIIKQFIKIYPIAGWPEELTDEDVEDELSFLRNTTAALAFLPLYII